MTRAPIPGRLTDCRDCHDPVRFVTLPSGKAIPVNPRPNPAGTVAARQSGHGLAGVVLGRNRTAPRGHPWRFSVHAATCTARRPAVKPAPDPALF